jgi:hypothetical protein
VYCRIDVLLYCCVGVLLCCCVVVLLRSCVVVLLCCCVVVFIVFKRLVVCCSYDIICHNNHIIINNMTKSASATASKTPPKKSSMPVKSYSMSPKKEVKEKKLGHKIINVTYPDKTPFGWAFDNFYGAKDSVENLSNRDGKVTIFGGIEFKPFFNLTTKWVKCLMLGNLLWISRIDTPKNGMEDSVPMQAHLTFANKIARAVICQNIFQEGGIDVVGISLNESQEADLIAHFHTNAVDKAREAIFQEAIRAAKEEVESLI